MYMLWTAPYKVYIDVGYMLWTTPCKVYTDVGHKLRTAPCKVYTHVHVVDCAVQSVHSCTC